MGRGFKPTTLCGRGMDIFWSNSIILRCIGLKVRAIIAKYYIKKSTHYTVTFEILFKTTHLSSFLWKCHLLINSQAFSRKLISNLMSF